MDSLEVWGRYLIWVKEPFNFPQFGVVKSLALPFQTTNMAHGPIALFAVLFKFLSKLYPPLGHFYYFVFVELAFVFLASFFAFLLFNEFKVKSFWLKLLGTVTVALSFPMLYRCLALPFETGYVPGYLAFAYFYVRAYKYPGFVSFVWLTLIFPIAVSVDDYLLLGIAIMLFACVVLNSIGYFMNNTRLNADRLRGVAAAFILGLLLSSAASYCLGNVGNMKVQKGVTPMSRRYDSGWGYGGGYGGGFHVADVLSVFIPPEYSAQLPQWKICGPTAYLAKLGFPLTTAKLQDGQYEGFAYAGTMTIGLLFLLTVIGIFSILKNYRRHLIKFDLKLSSNIFTAGDFFSLPMVLGISSFALYVISWGYIIHLGGIRHNDIVTPSLILAEYIHKFIWARSMGRLAIAFMLFIAVGVIVWLNSAFYHFIYSEKKGIRILCVAVFLLLSVIHIREIRGYLKPPEVVKGDDITVSFGKEDQALIRQVLHGKRVLMVTPYPMDNVAWAKICYALAFYGDIPMSGPNTVLNYMFNPGQYYADDQDILSGNILSLVARYGDIAIAASRAAADKILQSADIPLNRYRLKDRDVVLLTID